MRPTWGCRRSGKGPGGEEINANQWKTHGICMGYMYINVYVYMYVYVYLIELIELQL